MLLDLSLGGQSSEMEFASLNLSYPPFQWTSSGDAFEQLANMMIFCYEHDVTVPLRNGPGSFKDVYLKGESRTDAGVTRDLGLADTFNQVAFSGTLIPKLDAKVTKRLDRLNE